MLIEFYGKECPHCIRIEPLVARVEKEENVAFEKYEVWHNDENAMKQKEYDKDMCGGVPFFFNTENNAFVCGEVEYDELLDFVKK